MPTPPLLPRWLLERTLPTGAERDALLGDLEEEYVQLCATLGGPSARRWYWRQAMRSVAPNIVRRLGPRPWLAGMRMDLKLALRGLRRQPAFTATAAVTIGLGIGATTAVFSVVDATVLRALDLPEQRRLVSLWTMFERNGDREFEVSAAELWDLRADVRSFDRVGAWQIGETLLPPAPGGTARTIDVAFTSGDLYALVGAEVVLGRLPGPLDDRLTAAPVAVISHAFWREAFSSDPSVVGVRTLAIAGQPAVIVGVLSPRTTLPGAPAAAWRHVVLDPASWAGQRSGHGLTVLASLREGGSAESARAEIAHLHKQWAERYAGQHSPGLDGHTVHLAPVTERYLGSARRTGLLLAGAVGLLLALACANVANLLVARGESRTSELGVRVALGASAARVVQLVVLEGLTLGLVGGLVGLGVGAAALAALRQLSPADLAGMTEAGIDLRAVGFATLMSLSTGVLFSLPAAWSASRRPVADTIRVSTRSGTRSMRGLRTLVAGQTALATGLLAAALLLTLSLQKLAAVDTGLTPVSRVALDLTLPNDRYRDLPAILTFYRSARERIAALPGVRSVGAIRTLPLRDAPRTENVILEGATGTEPRIGVVVQAGSPGVIRTLGVRLSAGRDLSDDDRVDTPRVVLVNEAAARALWPGQSALGRRFRGTFLPPTYGLLTVVGVYADVRSDGLAAKVRPEILLPMTQTMGWSGWIRNMTLVVHSDGDAGAASAARAAIHGLDPAVAVDGATTMTAVVRASASRERFLATLIAAFSAAALIISAVGVFGVVSFAVARQRREFAIRSALGAKRSRIVASVLSATAVTAGTGALTGVLLALLSAPVLRGFLYEIGPRNPLAIVGAALGLFGIAILAAAPPALSALRVPLIKVLQNPD